MSSDLSDGIFFYFKYKENSIKISINIELTISSFGIWIVPEIKALHDWLTEISFGRYYHLHFQDMSRITKYIVEEETHRDSNCFCLTVIAHGNANAVLLDVNKKRTMDIEIFIEHLSDVKTLSGKPKILVFQACRGSKYQTYMSHFCYACKMRCPLNLVLESWEYL